MAPTPSKAEQIAEAEARGGRPADPPEGAGEAQPSAGLEATAPGDEIATPRPPASGEREVETRSPMKPTRVDPRDAIVKKFRAEVRPAAENDSDAQEIRRFANQGLPPELVDPPEPERAAEQQEEAAELPPVDEQLEPERAAEAGPKRKVKVRGREIELTDAELLDAAQRGLAGDSYFDEARAKANEANDALRRVNELLAQTREQGVRQPAAEHPGGERTGTPEATAGEHPAEPSTVDLVKMITFEDPEKAAEALDKFIEARVASTAAKTTQQSLVADREGEELSRSRAAVGRFMEANQELASDPRAVVVIKDDIARLQLEDIKKLGIEEGLLPKTPDQIGRWHLFYRAKGYQVRTMPELLEAGAKSYREWRGDKPETPAVDTGRRAAPRVAATVDRTARRATLQQQPTRAAVPRAVQQPAPDPLVRRQAAVQDMISGRRAQRSGGRVTQQH